MRRLVDVLRGRERALDELATQSVERGDLSDDISDLDRREDDSVADARRLGATWDAIADALGVSVRTARRRHSG